MKVVKWLIVYMGLYSLSALFIVAVFEYLSGTGVIDKLWGIPVLFIDMWLCYILADIIVEDKA